MDGKHLVTKQVYRIDIADMHVFLIVQPEGITAIDAGFPGTWDFIQAGLDDLGRKPEDIKDILVTHCHVDHAGGLAVMKAKTGAKIWMHAADADMVEAGDSFRPWKTAPGLMNWWFGYHIVRKSPQHFDAVTVDKRVRPGDVIPLAGGIKAIYTPGHCAGHMVYLWPAEGGVLFVGDAANNKAGLSSPGIFEDSKLMAHSLERLTHEKFRVACFAHGEPIVGHADAQFRAKWRKDSADRPNK
jgi:glyoxylase-like metal-dependent hydrolase (beta-lactamase superfamily II)